MKKILNALFLTLLTVFTFSSCSDVPAPYDILGEGDVPGVTGDGTKENPYNIEAAQQKQDGSVAWVQGYIVGAIENVYDDKGEFAGNKASFTAPFTITSNILIAESPDETNESKCLPVKVKNGSDLSTALNLKDHPENKGGVLLIQGELSAGFGKAALINTTAAVFNNKEIGEEQGGEDPEPPVGNVTFFEEAFASNKGSFTIEDKTRPTKVDEIWKWESYTPEAGGTASTYMKASAFISATEKEASESWLISPAVDLTKATSASLTFEHAHKFCGEPSKELTVWVKESTATDWTQVTIPAYATNSDWKFVSSGSISLSSYVGKNMQFAFKYMSTTSDVGTWEVRNVKVTGEGEGGGEEPTPPVEGTKIFVETFGTVTANTNVEGYKGWDNSDLTFSVNNPKVNLRTSLHKTEANKTESTVKISHIWFPSAGDNSFTISKINAAGYNKFVLYYEEAANTYNVGSSIDLNVLKIKFNGTEVVAGSKVVTAQVDKDDANIFYEMQVELNIAGTANSTLEFSALEADNTLGLRLANIRLYAVGEGGGTDPEPTGELLKNGSFEIWNDTKPEGWGRESATNATYSKYTENAQDGTTSVLISNTSTGNKRLGSDDVKLGAGNYTISVYAKNAAAGAAANLKVGYVPIKDDGTVDSNKYNYVSGSAAITLTDDWVKYEYSIELETEQTVSIVFMSSGSKNVPAKEMLIDNVSLIAKK